MVVGVLALAAAAAAIAAAVRCEKGTGALGGGTPDGRACVRGVCAEATTNITID